ncbi:MAG: PilZ domain-containing protein [Deltaproteobacteria bacterium]|jgi:hypothetical protein|nr:PilZ domain-containing protein [Deltaproteobacteria bacterium]
MLSIKATYEKGKIKLLESAKIKNNTELLITFLDDDYPFEETELENTEDYYKRIRKHERFKAKGNIIIVDDKLESTYKLQDYSAGGLSFISEIAFEVNQEITAAIKYQAADETLVMDFEIIARRCVPDGFNYKIGCQFKDSVEEELWHTIMQ